MAKTSVRPVYQKVDKWKREGKEERVSGGAVQCFEIIRLFARDQEKRRDESVGNLI